MITIGLDVGSLYTKGIILNAEGDVILASAVRETSGYISRETADFIQELLTRAGLAREEVAAIVSTGQGDELVEQADFCEDDVACIAAATRQLLPAAELTLEIGGQSITGVLSNPAGEVLNFMRNDKCASGSGRFVEVISGALGLSIEDIGKTVQGAEKIISISTQCAVFAESEIISYVNQGEPIPGIIAGVCDAMARIVVTQALRLGPVQCYTVTGGVALLSPIVKGLQERLKGEYLPFPIDPRLAAAYGAALLGREE